MTAPLAPDGRLGPSGEPGRPDGGWRLRDGILIGRLRGFPILLSPSWLLIAALITISYGRIATDAVPGLGNAGGHAVAFAFAVLFAASILAHELGHAFVADALALQVHKVVIFLLGGVSEIDPARRPRDEFLVAAAGPAVSLGLAGGLWAAWPFAPDDSIARVLIWLLLWSNVSVAVFNILPGLPLDGGRVLRAAVWGATRSRSAATAAAAWGGRILAVALLLGALALQGTDRSGPLLLPTAVVLAGFLWLSAGASLRAARVEQRVDALQARALVRPAIWAPAGTTLADAVASARLHRVDAVVVTDSVGAPSAIVDDEQVARLARELWPHVAVRDVAAPIAPGAVLHDSLSGEALLRAVRSHPALSYLVIGANREPLGVLRSRDLARAMAARESGPQ